MSILEFYPESISEPNTTSKTRLLILDFDDGGDGIGE